MGPGSLFTYFGSVPLTRCKRGDQGERHPPVCPGPGRQAQSRNSALAQMTQGISGSGARRWSVRKPCRAAQVQESSTRCLLYRGPGASPGVSLAPFWTFRKGPAPQGGHLYGPPAWDGWKGATSFVTASAVTPSPEGKAFGGHSVGRATLPHGEAARTRWKRSFGRGAHCAPLLLFFVKLN